ncbi:MAG: tetratricopeptide repeat protein [Patescibacteria group bacterium]|nr:tetratricopeptide repeat protein [Patescibacteria group bacterium]
MYNIIPLIIILLSLAVILFIIAKKLPLLAAFDVNSIPEEKEAETKQKIMEERLIRKAKHIYSKIHPIFKTIGNFLARKIDDFKNKMAALEERNRKKAKKEVLVTKKEFEGLEKNLDEVIAEAEKLAKEENYDLAEKKYIEAIGLDPKNISAYRGLGNIYLDQKHYEEAKQTFEHVLKLNEQDALAYASLGEIAEASGNHEEAQAKLIKALASAPNNPKYLDLLLTSSILAKDKETASRTLATLKEVNPENQKILEFEKELNNL